MDISQYLGYKVINPYYTTSKLTIRMLASHTSSLVDGPTYDAFLTYTYNTSSPVSIKEILIKYVCLIIINIEVEDFIILIISN